MFQPTTFPEPSMEEQLVQSTISGLRQLAELYGYEFEETIYHIQAFHALNNPTYTANEETYHTPTELVGNTDSREWAFEQSLMEDLS